jgi:hypothetical protein
VQPQVARKFGGSEANSEDKLMIETDAPWYVKGRGKRAQDGDRGKEDGM